MKHKFKLVGIFALGVAVGVGLMLTVVTKQFQDHYVLDVLEQANIALEVRADEQAALVQRIEARLPSYALTIHSRFPSNANATDALWMIKAYYERNSLTIPPEIKDILAALPPQPPTSCQLRLRALDKQTQEKKAPGKPQKQP